MSDMEDTETPVSSKGKADSLVPDSLEFDTNTDPLIQRDPQDQALSLQELIDAELTNRLSPQDSLEVVVPLKDGQADLESLISSDSIEDELRMKKDGADQLLSIDSVESVNIDVTNSNTINLNLDDLAKAEVENGIEVLSPNKLNVDDLSLPSGCHDSLESSSDLPGSPSRSTPDAVSPSAAQQSFSHQTLAPTDEFGIFGSVDKSNSSSAEDSTGANTIIPQTEDLLGLDSSFTNVSYSVQTLSNSSLEENLLESFSSIPATFQKQGTLESYEEGCEAFEIMGDSVNEVYMEDEKGSGTGLANQIHVVTRDTDLLGSHNIVIEGITAEEVRLDSSLVITEEIDQPTNLDGNRKLEIAENGEQILVDIDTKEIEDKEELPKVTGKDPDRGEDILASLACKEKLKTVGDETKVERIENGVEDKESDITGDTEIEKLETVENHVNEKGAKGGKDLDIFSENEEPRIAPETEVEVGTEVGIMENTDDDVLEVDLRDPEKDVNSKGNVKIIVTEENGEIISGDCDVKGASDGELVIVEDSSKPSNLEDQMGLELVQDSREPSDVESQLFQSCDETSGAETPLAQPDLDSRESCSGETELILDSQETYNAEDSNDLIIVEDTDNIKTETVAISGDMHGSNFFEGLVSTDSTDRKKSTDVFEDTFQEFIPDMHSSQQEKVEVLNKTETESSKTAPDAARQDIFNTSSHLTSKSTPSAPREGMSLNLAALCTEQTHAGVVDDLLTNDNLVFEKEAPNINANMGGKTYEDEEEEEGFDNDVPSSKMKKDEEDEEELREEDEEDEEAARTAFLMQMADGYEGEEREAVEAFIRSKLEQEKAEKAEEEEKDKENGEDEGEKKKKKKKRSEGGEKKSRKKKKKSDDKIQEDVEEGCSASSSSSTSSSSSSSSYSSGAEESEIDESVPKIEIDRADSRNSEEITSENYDETPLREESYETHLREESYSDREDTEYDASHSLTNGHHTESHSYTNGHHVSSSDEYPDEELSNVNVKKLTSAYLHSASHDDSGRSSGSESRSHLCKEEIVRPSVSIHQLMDAYTSPTKTPAKPEFPRIDKELPPEGTLHSRLNAYSAVAQNDSKPVTPKEEINVGVSFSSLKNAYVQSASKSRPPSLSSDRDCNGLSSPLKEEVNLNVSLTQLRETYCNTARSSSANDDARSASPACKTSPVVSTGVKIKDLCAAFSTPPPPSPQPSFSPSQHRRIITGVSVAQMKAAYNRDDLYEKHVGPRIRSFDASKMKSKFEKPKAPSQPSSDCRMCGKQVFQMEKIVAEKATWHKNCFRCKECNKNLTLETYQSHEGALYCKPHFKELFRPKAVVEDEATARKERSTDKPDYGLEDLQTNVREKFAMFETASREEEETKLEPVSVRRSQSLLSKVARFQRGESGEEYGVENSELGDYEEDEDEEEDEEEEEEGEVEDENADPDVVRLKKKKKGRPMSFSSMGDLKAAWETKNRRAEMAQNRKEELSKFRQMLCAGKNMTLKEMFESGAVDGEKTDKLPMREEIKIDGKRAASSLKQKFEQGRPFILEDEENVGRKANGEREEVEEIFKEAETAHKARNIFKQIDSHVTKEGLPVMRSQSFAPGASENRLSRDGLGGDDQEIGRDPNLIRCSDNYQDDVDCKNTRNVLAMFKKMELQANEDSDEGPRPLKRFTPPPDGEYDDEDEYSDEEYSDEEYSDEDDEDEEEEDSEGGRKPKYHDEVLDMAKQARKKSPQSAKRAASLRAKFERWESDQNEVNRPKDDDEECMPSIDTAKNLKAMFETKAQEVLLPKVQQPKVKVNRFVGGGGEKCIVCDKTVYAMEKLELQGKILHKGCFRCHKCNTKLSMGSFSIGGDHMYCTTHYKQLFAEKGTYDVFSPNGRGKWARKIEATTNDEETEPKSNS